MHCAVFVFSGQANGRLQLLTDSGKRKGSAVRAHDGEISCIASSGGSVLATASHDQFLKVRRFVPLSAWAIAY